MPTVKFNVKGVEPPRGGGEPIPKGVYACTIDSCVVNKPANKDERIEVVYKVKDGDQKGRQLWDYLNLESEAPFAQSRVREFLEAVGVVTDKKEAGSFDPAKLVGNEVNVRVIHQADTRDDHKGEMQHRVGGVFSLDDEEAEDLDEPEDEEPEEIDLDEMDRTELKKHIKENELGIRVTQKMSDDDIREAIAEASEEPEESEAEEPEEDEEPDEDEVDLDELERPALKKLIKEQELGIKVTQGMSDDDIRAKIVEALEEDSEEPEEGETPNYESMDLDDLKNTCKERGLKTTGSKKILAARLTKDDEAKDENDPF